MKSEQTLERIYPLHLDSSEQTLETIRLHYDRYRFAARYLKPGLVADVACGSGYGSRFLAESNPGLRIVSIDSNRDAIAYANENYAHPSIEFVSTNAMDFFAGREFQTVVSLETIEHLPDPLSFVQHYCTQLAPGGRFIASAPVTPSMDANPFHLHDFSHKSFKKLFTSCGLKEIHSELQVQAYKPFLLLKGDTERKLRKNLIGYYFKHPGKAFLRLRSILSDGFKNKYLLVVFEKQ